MHWTVARTEAQREGVAQRHLERACFETYFPRVKTTGRRVDKWGRCHLRPPIEALFKNYLFIRIGEQWYPIKSTIGITNLILDGLRPAVLPDAYIDELRSQEGPDGLVRLPKARPEFLHGDQIRIVGGPFEGRLGLFEGMRAKDRVEVLRQ